MTMASLPQGSRPTIAAHHWAFHHLDIEEACAYAAGLGYDGLDLAIGEAKDAGRVDIELLASDAAERQRFADAGRAYGVRFTDLVAGVILGADDAALDLQRELLGELAMRLPELGLTGMTVIPGLVGETPFADAEALVRSELTRLVAATAPAGVGLSIEPHVYSVTDTPQRAAKMLDDVPGLTLTLDYSHFVLPGFGPDDIEPLHGRARHLHVRQAKPGAITAPVASGTIDHRRLLTRLHAGGYRGALTTEYVESPFLGQDAVDAVVENEAMRRELEALVTELWGPR